MMVTIVHLGATSEQFITAPSLYM